MVLIMLGAPGAGKGTVGKKVAEELGATYIATGDIFREIIKQDTPLAKEINECIKQGKLVPDELAIKIFMEDILPEDLSKDIILDGYPRTEGQAKHLDKVLEEKGLKVNCTINIDVSSKLIIDRIVNRRICPECNEIYNLKYGKKPFQENVCNNCGSQLIQRIDDNEETIKDRLHTYEVNTKPLINYYEKQGKLKNIEADEHTSIEELVSIALDYTQE